MSFGENLQFYRKRKDITQEQLAEQMDVSRQTISKWESDSSYPEMEKLIQLCDLFGCTMDTLLRGNVQESLQEDTEGYDRHMDWFSVKIVTGIGVIFLSVILETLGEAFRRPEYLVNSVFLLVVMVGILLLIGAGVRHSRFVKKHPYVRPFYQEEEIEHAENKFTVSLLTGIGIIFAGVLFSSISEGIPILRRCEDEIYLTIPLMFFAVGTCILVYAGMQKSKYNVVEYNEENSPSKGKSKRDRLISTWCGCIMLIATIIFIIAGLGYEMWSKCWIVYPVGGMLCGVAVMVINGVCKEG